MSENQDLSSAPSRRGSRWVKSLFIIFVALVTLAAAVLFLNKPVTTPTGQTIPLSPEVSLHLAAVLTKTNPEFVFRQPGYTLPNWLRSGPFSRFVPRRLLGSPPSSISTSISRPDEAKLVFTVQYPKAWLTTLPIDDITQKLTKAFASKGIRRARLVLGPGSYSSTSYVNDMLYGSYTTVPGPHGRPMVTDHYPSVMVEIEAPPFQEELIVQLLNESYDNPEVLTTLTLPNPLHRKVASLPPAPPLPQTKSDGNLDVTLQAVIGEFQSDTHPNFIDRDGRQAIEFIKNKPLPKSGPIPADHFPHGEPTAAKGYSSAIIMSLQKNGSPLDDWSINSVKVTYGADDLRYPSNSTSWQGTRDQKLIVTEGNMSAYPQPLKFTASLIHSSNFAPDEEQSVEIPLPREGSVLFPKATLKLWDNTIVVESIGYKTTHTIEGFPIKPDQLFIHSTGLTGSQLNDIKVIGEGQAPVDLNRLQSSWMSINNKSLVHFDPTKSFFDLVTSTSRYQQRTITYSDFTTAVITVRHGKPYPNTFEFTANAEPAKGPLLQKE